jgi:lipopolysaccharide assembly outer membrane protein LptD (OstA)
MARSLRARTAVLVLGWLVLCAGAAFAQGIAGLDEKLAPDSGEPATLTADRLEYDAKREVYSAHGNVVIVQGDRTLSADWVAFSPVTHIGVASGNVQVVDGDDTLRADFLEFQVETLQGVIRNGSLDSPGSRFRTTGAEIHKTGENTWHFEDGTFTTCRCPEQDATDPWRIRAEEADVEIGGYGTVEDATFEVKGVPVLWLPWMIYPIKTERQTGFLFPDVSIASRNGFGVGLPFFWAPLDELNVTLTPEWTTRRGFEGDAAVEYVLGEESEGELVAALAFDRDIHPNSLDEPYARERWLLGGAQDLHLPLGARFQTSYSFASDNDVPLDFDELSAARADRYLDATASLSRGFGANGRFGAVGLAWFADDLQSPDDVDRDEFLLQRMPQVQIAALPGGLPRVPLLRPSFDARYARFDAIDAPPNPFDTGFLDVGIDAMDNAAEIARTTLPGPPADPHLDAGISEGDGSFQEGEPLTDAGHRVDLEPRLAAPVRLGRVAELYPEVGWHQTFYDSRERGADDRGLLTGRVDLRSRLRRRFGAELVHVVEPLVGWAYVSPRSQSDLPLFVPATALPQERIRSLDLDAPVRDPADRIERVHRLSFGATQRVFGAGEPGPRGALRADVTVIGLYDLEEDDFGNVVLDGRVSPAGLGSLRVQAGLDTDQGRVDEGLAQWSFSHRDGHELIAMYRYLRDVPEVFEEFRTGDRFDHFEPEDRVDEVAGSLRLAVTRQLSVSYRTAYSFETDLLLVNQGVVEYLSKCGCFTVGAELSEDRARGVSVRLIYRLVGLGRDEEPNPGGLLDW